MNANAKNELAEVTATQSAVDAMAVVTLSPEKYAAEVYQPFNDRLAAAIEGVKAIDYDIKTTAGMAVAVKARATFRDLRTEADNERKERKAPITKIGKLLESHFDMVEERSRPLEALFDADIQAEIERKEAEKAAKIAAERARTDAIQARIAEIRGIPIIAAGKSSEFISRLIASLVGDVPNATFEEFEEAAKVARHEILDKLAAMETAQRAIEIEAESQRQEAARQAAAAEEARKAEAARIEQERAALAAQRAENERIANEQAAERRRLADQQAAQERAAKELADKAAANLRAEREVQELAMRLEREKAAKEQAERDRVAADLKRQLDEQQAAIAAERQALIAERQAQEAAHAAALRRNDDHELAIAENAQFDADRETERQRLQALADEALADARLPRPESQSLRDALIDAGFEDIEVTDEEITEMGAEWGLDKPALIVRLRKYIADSEVAV